MGFATVVPPDFDQITLAEAKEHLRVDGETEDATIAAYIIAARKFCEGQTHRVFATQTILYTLDCGWPYGCYDGYYQSRIELPVAPVQSISTISYVDSNGTTQALGSSDYVLRADVPVPYVVPAYGVTWPSVRLQPACISVQYIAGWARDQFPDDLKVGMLMLIGHFYANRETVAQGTNVVETPFATEALISPYRLPQVA